MADLSNVLTEKLQVLLGERGTNKGLAAVRKNEIGDIIDERVGNLGVRQAANSAVDAATQAAGSAGTAAASSAASIVAQELAVAQAEFARQRAEAAQLYRTDAQTAEVAARLFADDAEASRAGADLLKQAARLAADDAEASRAAAELLKQGAENALQDTEAAKAAARASEELAAQHAGEAITNASAAQSSADAAGQQATAAQLSRTAAETAAGSAATKAAAAAESASAAAASATEAVQSASASQTARIAAETAGAGASVSASNAANSATVAGNAQTAASQSASASQAAKTAAETAQSSARVSENSAATSAATAAGSATNASQSATAASNALVEARARSTRNLWTKSSFGDGLIGGWSGVAGISTVAMPSAPNGETRALRWRDAGIWEMDADGSYMRAGSWAGRRLRFTGWVWTEFSSFAFIVNASTVNSAGQTTTVWATQSIPAGVASWQAFSLDIVLPADAVTCVPWLVSQGQWGAAGHDMIVIGLRLEDVTDSAAAKDSAMAAASSASAASASATDAGQQATAAQQAKTEAQTASGSAGVSATNAATSATSAANSAASASASAQTAVQARTDASGYASVSQQMAAQVTDAVGGIQAKYSVKVDVNGWVSGFGLISEANNAAPRSTFTVLADNFLVAKPGAGGSATQVFEVGTVNGVSKLVMRGDMWADGTIGARALSVGTSVNLLVNADFMAGLDCWALEPYSTTMGQLRWGTIRAVHPAWVPSGVDGVWVQLVDASSGSCGVHAYGRDGSPTFPVQPGRVYEASVYTGAHRCVIDLQIRWHDANGAVLGHSYANGADDTGGLMAWSGPNALEKISGSNLADAKRLFVIGRAPAGAVSAAFTIIKNGTATGGESVMFAYWPQFGEAPPNAREPSPWSLGAVLVRDGQITAPKIAAGAITADKILAQQITTEKLMVGGVTMDRIAPNAVTNYTSVFARDTVGGTQFSDAGIYRTGGTYATIRMLFRPEQVGSVDVYKLNQGFVLVLYRTNPDGYFGQLDAKGITIPTDYYYLTGNGWIAHFIGGFDIPYEFVDVIPADGWCSYSAHLWRTTDGAAYYTGISNRFLNITEFKR